MSNRTEILFHVRPPLALVDLLETVHEKNPLPPAIHVWLHRWQTLRTDTPMPMIANADEWTLYDLLKPPDELIKWLEKVRQIKGLQLDTAAYLRQWAQGENEISPATGEIKLAA